MSENLYNASHYDQSQEHIGALCVVESVERAIASAYKVFCGFNGDYFLHIGESINDSEHTAVWRADPNKNLYEISGEANNAPVDHTGSILWPGKYNFRRRALSIQLGQLPGRHLVRAQKILSSRGPQTVLEATITCAHSDQFLPITAVDLTLNRNDAYGGAVGQKLYIESDPNTGATIVSNSMTAVFSPDSAETNDTPNTDLHVADILQDHFKPNTPVNRDLTFDEWQQLLIHSLTQKDLLQE